MVETAKHRMDPIRAPQQLRWSAQEYSAAEKSTDWYWAVGVLAVLGSIASILFGNILLALLILLGSFLLALFASKHGPEHTFTLSQRGLVIDSRLYPYQTLSSFWIETEDPDLPHRLLIRSQKSLTPLMIIPLGDADPDEVHRFLLRFLPEQEEVEPVAYRIMERLGF